MALDIVYKCEGLELRHVGIAVVYWYWSTEENDRKRSCTWTDESFQGNESDRFHTYGPSPRSLLSSVGKSTPFLLEYSTSKVQGPKNQLSTRRYKYSDFLD